MDSNVTALERAFELARSGKYSSVSDLRSALSREGYSASQIDGPALGRQLRSIMDKTRRANADQA
jgi:hypothetical protein